MRILLAPLWICAALFAAFGLASPTTVNAQPRKTVADWAAIANRYLAQGKPKAAMVIFGEIAARHPNYTPAQDGLQHSLAKLGSARRAEAFLRYAVDNDPAHERALLAAWQALDRAHPLRFSGSASILPSTNIEHVASERYFVTNAGTFLISDGGNETSGVGLGFRLTADWLVHPQPQYRFRFRASLAGAWFDSPRLRYGEPSLSLSYEHLGGRGPWSLGAFASKRRYGGEATDITDDNTTQGLDFRKRWRLASGGRVFLRMRGEYRRYSEKPYLTGPRYNASLERLTPIGAKGVLSYGLQLERALPRTDYHRYTGAGVQIGYERPLFDKMRAGVSLGLLQRNFDADFPIVGKRRRDQTVSLGVSVETRKISILGRHPKVNCTARRTRSNISLYTTNSFDCALTLKLDF